jgi:arylsulfatase A-like enzyme
MAARRAFAVGLVSAVIVSVVGVHPGFAQPPHERITRPNVVLVFPDNVGMGEIGIFGGDRFVPTPRLDRLASEGLRLTNFNTEWYCTPSRASMLTGRFSVRTGTNGVPKEWSGLTQWEITLPELLAPHGYASALFGKWHLGDRDGRYPSDQGFDEWYGILRSSDEAQGVSTKEPSYIWEGRRGEQPRKVKVFDMESRRLLDRESIDRGVAFMERTSRLGRPFILYLPLTQIHFPTLPHPEFAGKTGAGDVGDAVAEMDRNVGVLLDAIRRLNLDTSTIVIFAGDGGAEFRRPWRGTAGPWRGFYTTAMEGGLRTPFVIRWPGRIPAGRASNEIVHQVDVFTTVAAALGVMLPQDRAIDGANQLPFFEGRQAVSNREGFPIFTNGQVRAVKWHDWKLHYAWQDDPNKLVEPSMKLFNLRYDPKEETDIKDFNPWAERVMQKVITDFDATLARYPLIPPDTPDPYVPPTAGAAPPTPVAITSTVPAFSGKWSLITPSKAPGTGPHVQSVLGDMGSGWGPDISVTQDTTTLTIEYQPFFPRDIQPPVKLVYLLDGSESRNAVVMGRGFQVQRSRTSWKGASLVITTAFTTDGLPPGGPSTSVITQVLSLDSPTLLRVQITRDGLNGGPASSTTALYRKDEGAAR